MYPQQHQHPANVNDGYKVYPFVADREHLWHSKEALEQKNIMYISIRLLPNLPNNQQPCSLLCIGAGLSHTPESVVEHSSITFEVAREMSLALPLIFQLGGGYLFGLPIGFVADSIGATTGAAAAFLLGRTIGRSYVISKLKDYPKFQVVAIAIQRSGFKIVLLLRLVPLLPFNMLNYLLSVTPVSMGEYVLASWLGMMPITFTLVYVGTTLKDLSEVTHGWDEISTSRLVYIILGLVISGILMVCVTKVAKSSLEKALAENGGAEILVSGQLPITSDSSPDLSQSLIIKIESPADTHEK